MINVTVATGFQSFDQGMIRKLLQQPVKRFNQSLKELLEEIFDMQVLVQWVSVYSDFNEDSANTVFSITVVWCAPPTVGASASPEGLEAKLREAYTAVQNRANDFLSVNTQFGSRLVVSVSAPPGIAGVVDMTKKE